MGVHSNDTELMVVVLANLPKEGVHSNDTELVVVVLPDPSERYEYIATIQN